MWHPNCVTSSLPHQYAHLSVLSSCKKLVLSCITLHVQGRRITLHCLDHIKALWSKCQLLTWVFITLIMFILIFSINSKVNLLCHDILSKLDHNFLKKYHNTSKQLASLHCQINFVKYLL